MKLQIEDSVRSDILNNLK